ncbi:protein NRT1/ PTR FAMILY 5.10-like isoform X2 [Iris pallida]|uniref:Protein NRT1/ PTR FAMILY 5.10-like isoform X2 n=2 Tax=Iris pallida TaxID=29817 RepID=A0AAX6GIX3_IRIPA|nr:protein NRT1/ PTR FAMILY 5.10-like isoform X2 [Iris pallida]
MDSDPLLLPRPVPFVVGHDGRPVSKSSSGRWSAALFIIGVEVAERFAYYGISSNMITYLTGPLGEPTAASAAAVNTWSGVASMTPLLGAFVADSYLGRYRTIMIASLLYLLALGMLTLSSVMPTLHPHMCSGTSCPPTQFQIALFFSSIYLVAFAQGGHKPCVQAFGADQFDQNDPEESISRSSFFNWWYFSLCAGTVVTILVLNYVQDNISWSLGFGIPCIAMGIGLAVFLLGTKNYRYYLLEEKSPFARIGRAFATLVQSQIRAHKVSGGSHPTTSEEDGYTQILQSDQSKLEEEGGVPSARQVEEAKGVLRLFPIWATCLIYAVVFAQSSTFFTKQGSTLDRRISSTLQVPPAALQSFISMSIVAFIPIYDRILVPIARKFSKIPTGFTLLQRIGIGMVLSMIAMVIAAVVETKRLKIARDYGLVDLPSAMIPMSLWWLVPQYVLYGIADVFTMVGLQEFFYDQVPDALRSLGLALYLSIFGIGSFISSFLVSVIDDATKRTGDSWFSNNLNRAHLDYFYWLLAGLSALELVIYLFFAWSYVYKKKASTALSS